MAKFINQATLELNGATIRSNVVEGEITPTLAVEKYALQDTYRKDDKVTYVVSLVNNALTELTGMTLTDDLGAAAEGGVAYIPLDYVPDSLLILRDGVPYEDYTQTGGGVEINGLSLPAGSNMVIAYEANVNEFAPLEAGGAITNTVTLSGGSLSMPVTASKTITVDNSPALTIEKSLFPAQVMEDGVLTYTFTIRNYGAEVTADSGLAFRDAFNPKLVDPTVQQDGTDVPADQYGYDADDVFFINAGYLTVPAAVVSRDPASGREVVIPGETVITVSGTI